MPIPPNIGHHTRELILQGRWSCIETDEGFEIYTEPYSACCNPHGQTKYTLNKQGQVLGQEAIPLPPGAEKPRSLIGSH